MPAKRPKVRMRMLWFWAASIFRRVALWYLWVAPATVNIIAPAIATIAANIWMVNTNPFTQSLKHVLEEPGLMNMHPAQMYTALKMNGMVLTTAAAKMS